MASQPGTFNLQELADAGAPLVGGRLYTYAYGTTTSKTAYTDQAATVPHTYTADGLGGQYIALNARGELPAPLYLASGSYDLALKRADGSTVWTRRADGQASASDVALYATSGGSALVGFLQAGTGAAARTVQDKLRDIPAVRDYGAAVDGATNDAAAITAGFAANAGLVFGAGTHSVQSAVSQSFGKTAILLPSAYITPSGAGSITYSGAQVAFGYNPSVITNWTTSAGNSVNGLGVDFGGFGPRSFSGIPNLCAIEGATLIPAGATTPANGVGVSGYVNNNSTTTNGVAVYGEAKSLATNALIWGFNSRSIDNGLQTTVWGGEFDVNLTNANSVAKGVDIVGGSTVEPAVTIGLRIGPLGTFTSPPKRWARGILVDDGAAITGIELGAASKDTNSGSLPIVFYYYNAANARTQGAVMGLDASGNFTISNNVTTALLTLQTGSAQQIRMTGSALAFYGQTPALKQTVSGSRGGNAALQSLLTALSAVGLFNDSTTA